MKVILKATTIIYNWKIKYIFRFYSVIFKLFKSNVELDLLNIYFQLKKFKIFHYDLI